MTHEKKVSEQNLMNNHPTLQYFTSIRHQEPEYEHVKCLLKVIDDFFLEHL